MFKFRSLTTKQFQTYHTLLFPVQTSDRPLVCQYETDLERLDRQKKKEVGGGDIKAGTSTIVYSPNNDKKTKSGFIRTDIFSINARGEPLYSIYFSLTFLSN